MSGTIVLGNRKDVHLSQNGPYTFQPHVYHNRPAQDHGDVSLGLKTDGTHSLEAVGAHVSVYSFDGQIGWVVVFPTAAAGHWAAQGGRLLRFPTASTPRPLRSTALGPGPTILGRIPSPRILPLLPPDTLSLLCHPVVMDPHLLDMTLVQAPCLFLGPLRSLHSLEKTGWHGRWLHRTKHNKQDEADKLHTKGGDNDVMVLVV